MKSISIRAVAVGLMLASGSAARAQTGAASASPAPTRPTKQTPEENRRDTEDLLQKAAELIQRYEKLVAKYNAEKSKNGGDPALAACLKGFDANKVFATTSAGPLPYHQKAVVYQACEGLLDGSPQACLLLAPMGGYGDAHFADYCRRLELRLSIDRGIGSGAAIVPACEQMLTLSSTPEGLKGFPADARGKVCDLLGKGASGDKIGAALRASGTPPSDEDVQRIVGFLTSFGDPHRKCKADCSGGCCDVVAVSRARVAHDPEKCGSNALCRAAFGAKNACDPLFDDFARTYCKEAVAVEAKSGVVEPAVKELQNAYLAANGGMTAALNRAYGLEPHNDEANAKVIEKAKSLLARFNDIPKWGDKPAPKTAPAKKKGP